MPIVKVDRSTFTALCLAQAAISYARHALPYGSANQYQDMHGNREGGKSGAQSLPRLKACRTGAASLMAQSHGVLPDIFGATAQERAENYRSAINAGVALYYGAGNCGEHAMLTFHFLSTFGYPGIEIIRASSTTIDHAYTVITWKGCSDPVVCDAWPTKPQACLWSQFFANPRRTVPDPGFKAQQRHTITDRNMGSDLIGDAYRLLSPSHVGMLPLASRVKGMSPTEIEQWLQTVSAGTYDHVSTLQSAYQPWVDFDYQGQRVSNAAPIGERWTASIEPVIVEANRQLRVLDPALRYARRTQAA